MVEEINRRLGAQVGRKAPLGEQMEWFTQEAVPFGKTRLLPIMAFLSARGFDAAAV